MYMTSMIDGSGSEKGKIFEIFDLDILDFPGSDDPSRIPHINKSKTRSKLKIFNSITINI